VSSTIEEEEAADLRDDLRGLPFERIMLEAEGVRWTGELVDLAGEAGVMVGKGTEG
jgi:hypothetical protein